MTEPTIKTITERQFCEMWIHLLSTAMLRSGKGFRLDSPRRQPRKGAARWYGERRADKNGSTKVSRALLAGGSR